MVKKYGVVNQLYMTVYIWKIMNKKKQIWVRGQISCSFNPVNFKLKKGNYK